jgi:hypothetical protein
MKIKMERESGRESERERVRERDWGRGEKASKTERQTGVRQIDSHKA